MPGHKTDRVQSGRTLLWSKQAAPDPALQITSLAGDRFDLPVLLAIHQEANTARSRKDSTKQQHENRMFSEIDRGRQTRCWFKVALSLDTIYVPIHTLTRSNCRNVV